MNDAIKLTRLLTEHPELLLREGARRSLRRFVQMMKPGYVFTPFHLSYIRVLQKFADGEIRNLIIQAPPQHGKSEQSSRMLPSGRR